MFQPMPEIPQAPRGPIGVVADSVAEMIARALGRVAAPTRDPFDFLLGVLPTIPTLIQLFKPSAPVDMDGPTVQQVKRELAAQEAQLAAEAAAKRARLVADFAARFDVARIWDNAARKFENAPPAKGNVDGESQLQ